MSPESASVSTNTIMKRSDYVPTAFVTDHTKFNFDVHDDRVDVHATFQISKNAKATPASGKEHVLNRGISKVQKIDSFTFQGLTEAEVSFDSSSFGASGEFPAEGTAEKNGISVRLTPSKIYITVPESNTFTLISKHRIYPDENTALEGLYRSDKVSLISQCESEGFRNISPSQDRPDVLSKYEVRITSRKDAYKQLLSNGNLVASGEVEGDSTRHFATWVDPFPKPSYLFALCMGNFSELKDTFKSTLTDKVVDLHLYCIPDGGVWDLSNPQSSTVSEPSSTISRLQWAMKSLKDALLWDEKKFGLIYPFEAYRIVAANDFNMGAMENSTLNVFNTRLLVANEKENVDLEYVRIHGVVGHECFHIHTGNRVTLRHWFDLTLKEGLTVFRDQEFTSEHYSRPVARIKNVQFLRSRQFLEDKGAMAHPIRPDEAQKIDNFYTVTVYEKGAEVIRLYNTILGEARFRKGMDLYFARHSNQAVECDDFWAAMHDANVPESAGPDDTLHTAFMALKNWYSQAGTPSVKVSTRYDPVSRVFSLHASQSYSNSHNGAGAGPAKLPVLIPIAFSLIDGKNSVPLRTTDNSASVLRPDGSEYVAVLPLTTTSQEWSFADVPASAIPSILRDFSAPVYLTIEGQSKDHLLQLLANDTDPFNRWESGQRLYLDLLLRTLAVTVGRLRSTSESGDLSRVEQFKKTNMAALEAAKSVDVEGIAAAVANVLEDSSLDGQITADMMMLPSDLELLQQVNKRLDDKDPEFVGLVSEALRSSGSGFDEQSVLDFCRDPVLVHCVRSNVFVRIMTALGDRLATTLAAVEAQEKLLNPNNVYTPDVASINRRALRKMLILAQYRVLKIRWVDALAQNGESAEAQKAHAALVAFTEDVHAKFENASNMTEEYAMLGILEAEPVESEIRTKALQQFFEKHKDDNLVILKYFSMLASSAHPDSVETVKQLKNHPLFDIKTPNMCYSLFLTFAQSFPVFHAADGSGYRFMAESLLEVDKLNGQVGSALANTFSIISSVDPKRKAMMKKELDWVASHELTANTRELIEKFRA